MKLQELASKMEECSSAAAISNLVTDGQGNILRVTLTNGDCDIFHSSGYLLASETEEAEGTLSVFIPNDSLRDTFLEQELTDIENMAKCGEDSALIIRRLCQALRSLKAELKERREEIYTLLDLQLSEK